MMTKGNHNTDNEHTCAQAALFNPETHKAIIDINEQYLNDLVKRIKENVDFTFTE